MNQPQATDQLPTEEYLKLLLEFGALPKVQIRRTFMEISGYPHYENVCSNILKFYFDPEEEHGLDDLFLVAFLQMAGNTEVPKTRDIHVWTQEGTATGKFIDIVVASDSFVIGIENKISHWLANDLEDYGKHLDSLGQKGSAVIKAVLGLNPVTGEAPLKGGFKSYTYEQFWSHVLRLMPHHISKADNKWMAYLFDLIETTNRLAGKNMELNQRDQFFIEHNDRIEKLIKEREEFFGRLNDKIRQIHGSIKESDEAKEFLRTDPWIYKNSCLALDLKMPGKRYVAFDLLIKPTGWQLEVFGRNRESEHYFRKHLLKNLSRYSEGVNSTFGEGRTVLKTWAIHKDIADIQDDLLWWMEKAVEAGQSTLS